MLTGMDDVDAPKWDINLFNLPDEQAASTKVLLK